MTRQPSPEHDPQGDAKSLAQKAQWERDRKVQVTLRPLRYEYARGADGRPVTDVHGVVRVEHAPGRGFAASWDRTDYS